MKSLARYFALVAACAPFVAGAGANASDDTVLVRVLGGVGYTAGAGAAYAPVVGQQLMQDGYFAVVRKNAQAMLLMPDSSQVGLGSNTVVQISAFLRSESGNGSTIGIPSTGGIMRFNVKHPQGARANYTFVTPTTSIAVRGTSGLLSSVAGRDIVVCLDCSAHSLVVTRTQDGKTFEITTGQTLVISASTASRTATTPSILQPFTAAGLTTTATAAMPVLAAGSTTAQPYALPLPSRNPGLPPPTATNGITTR